MMVSKQMAVATLVGAALGLALCGCGGGEVAGCCDSGVDLPAQQRDLSALPDAPGDAGPAQRDAAPGDSGVRREGSAGGDTTVDAGPCGLWSNWTCKADPVVACRATCNKGALPQAMSCIVAGDCLCGISTGSCGNFGGGASGCEICRKAVVGGCCK